MTKHIDVAKMVNRFLGWKLPQDFAPDGGITFKPSQNGEHVFWPIGTNLLTADQAKQMFEYCLREALAQPFDLEAAVKADIDRDLKELRRELDGEFIRRMAQPQGEWVDLTDDEILEASEDSGDLEVNHWRIEYCREVIAKFKEKNTPPVVPQGEPVAWIEHEWSGTGSRQLHFERRGYSLQDEVYRPIWTPLYTTPPSVEAAIEATKEKAAKVCPKCGGRGWYICGASDQKRKCPNCAEAIRSMK